MTNKLLAIDKNEKTFSKYQTAWLKAGINSVRVSSMQEAIELLAREVFVIVRINADNIHYLPMLPMVRGLTKAHIGVVTSSFTMVENIEALKNGADNFYEWWNNSDESVQRGIVLMQKCMEYCYSFE